VAANDSASGQASASVTINVLDNDQDADGNLDRNSVRFVQPPAGATLSGDGRSLQVPNEGSWQVGSEGAVVFAPASGFTGSPTVVSYTVSDATGLTSAAATITITVAAGSGGGTQPGTPLARHSAFSCGNLDIGGSDSSYRGYTLFLQGAGDTMDVKANRFLYSEANCAGTRSFEYPESSLLVQARMTPVGVEQLNGYTVRRYKNDAIMPGDGSVVTSFQITYTTTPNGAVCVLGASESFTAAEIVESIEQDSSHNLNCGTWEKLN
jgi:CshA-type fibril repeat protein